MHRTFGARRLAAAALLSLLLSGCLVTFGGPLARRVEPGRWRIEGGGGPSLGNPPGILDGALLAYAGRALGRHFEAGLMPCFYTIYQSPVLTLALPVRWDPFPHDWAFHLVPFAGPALYSMPTVSDLVFGVGGLAGLGFSLRFGELAELYAAGSLFIPAARFVTASAGVRFDLKNGFELGLGAVFASPVDSYPGLVLGTVTVSTFLGKPSR
jgi:hypothetical protein